MAGIRLGQILAVALISLVASFIYTRLGILYTFYANAPTRLQGVNNFKTTSIRFRNLIRNCEDGIIDAERGFALLSCDPGRDNWNTVMGVFRDSKAPEGTGIYIYHYANDESVQPKKLKLLDFKANAIDFHPLGIEYDAANSRIFIVNHAGTGSKIEVFKLFIEETAATHIGSITHPLLHAPNSIALLSDTELLVSNDHYFLKRSQPSLAAIETYLGLPGGNIAHVKLSDSVTQTVAVKILARVPFANGVALMNDTALAVASTSGAAVLLYKTTSGFQDVSLAQTIHLPFLPDNLSVDGDGIILIAGHPFAPAVETTAQKNAFCSHSGVAEEHSCKERAPSWVAEWSSQAGLRNLYIGNEISTSTTAIRDVQRGIGLVTGLYDSGLLWWKEE